MSSRSVRSGITADSVFDWGSEQEYVKKLAIDQFQQWAESSSGSCSLTTVEDTKPPVAGRYESNRRLCPNHFKDLTDLVNEESDSSDEDLDFDIEMTPAKSRSFPPIKKPKPDSLHKQVLVFVLIISVLVGGLIAIGVEISSTHPEEYAHELGGQSTKESHQKNGSPQNKTADYGKKTDSIHPSSQSEGTDSRENGHSQPPDSGLEYSPSTSDEQNIIAEDGKKIDPIHPPVHQSEGTDPRGNEHSQPPGSGLEYLPSASAEQEQAVEKSSAMPPPGAIDGLTYQQYLLEEAELVSTKCSTDRMQCEQVCQHRMCCFEEDDQKSCIEDANLACPAYVACGILLEEEAAIFSAGQ
ncbi:hypothetical protein THAOC_16747 [Thalassiosira oceanica]|uniref:Uncharacterized protein n=1 Tax=Thalassiosira oceanica TaxID=159749 RepID=K0SNW7_THAOC|nr:hypothetical protein THAOC_16747 [Thalassiosira oceanica]|eukprot:EJK62631.1 hypothetical protein THAOC_16747 [Thalassiosira oceanica]